MNSPERMQARLRAGATHYFLQPDALTSAHNLDIVKRPELIRELFACGMVDLHELAGGCNEYYFTPFEQVC